MVDMFTKSSSGEENDRIKYGASCMRGNRKEMHDVHTAILDLGGSDPTSFFGVFDGHGGDKVALYCAEQLPNELVQDPHYENDLPTAIRNVYSRIDENLKKPDESMESHSPPKGNLLRRLGVCPCSLFRKTKPYIGPQGEGTTACVALIRGNQITVGNAGDSRCVLSRGGQAIDLSTDHKPDHPNERARIQAAGGHVVFPQIDMRQDGRRDRTMGVPRLDGKIAISRALGDFEYKKNPDLDREQQKMICNPDIRTENITDDTDFLLIASNGIWSEKSSKQVVDYVHRKLGDRDLSVMCEGLLDWCITSDDNSTVILVQFKNDAPMYSSVSCPRPQVNDPAATTSSSPSCSPPQANSPSAIGSTSSESKADTETEIKVAEE